MVPAAGLLRQRSAPATIRRQQVSTTLIPPTQYVVKPDGCRPQLFATISQAAVAIVQLTPVRMRVGAVTGMRTRELSDSELHELGCHIRVARLRARRARTSRTRAPRAPARSRVPVGG